MTHTPADVDELRPAGSKRSSKREFILNVFLRQEGHLTADDLFDLIRREDSAKGDGQLSPRISRATVYRTLEKLEELGLIQRVHRPEGCQAFISASQGLLRFSPARSAIVSLPVASPNSTITMKASRFVNTYMNM